MYVFYSEWWNKFASHCIVWKGFKFGLTLTLLSFFYLTGYYLIAIEHIHESITYPWKFVSKYASHSNQLIGLHTPYLLLHTFHFMYNRCFWNHMKRDKQHFESHSHPLVDTLLLSKYYS